MHSVGALQPSPRSSAAAVCLDYGTDHPQLLLVGGYNKSSGVLSDAWSLDVFAQGWQQVRSSYFVIVLIIIIRIRDSQFRLLG